MLANEVLSGSIKLAQELGKRLRALNYTSDTVAGLLGGAANVSALRAGNFYPAKTALAAACATDSTPDRQALATLVALFELGQSIPQAQLQVALPDISLEQLCAAGLLSSNIPGFYKASLGLEAVTFQNAYFPCGSKQLLIFSDLPDHLRTGEVAADHVMGVGGATHSLVAQLPEACGKDCADIGCGSGAIALALAESARTVVASDISKRALALARFNAVLNEVHNIEFVHSDLVTNLRGRVFDVIASNPPFVITPKTVSGPQYRSGGKAGDKLVFELAASLPELLAPNGRAVLLCNWEVQQEPQASAEKLLAAVTAPNIAAAYLNERDLLPVLDYAAMWIRDGGVKVNSDAGQQQLAHYLQDFTSRNVTHVAFGVLHLQAGAAGQCARTAIGYTQHTTPVSADLARAVTALLASAVVIANCDTAAFAKLFLVTGKQVLEQRIHRPGAADPHQIVLLNTAPYTVQRVVSPEIAAVLGACDGQLSLGQLVAALANLWQVDAAALLAQVIGGLEQLVWDGYFNTIEA